MQAKKREGHDKLLNYLEDLSDSTDFKFAIAAIRRKFDIASTGYRPTPTDFKEVANPHHFPRKHQTRQGFDQKKVAEDLFTEMTRIVHSFPVDSLFYFLLLRNYIFYNQFLVAETQKKFPFYKYHSLCKFDFSDSDTETTEQFPIVIKISTEATGVDIQDFLNTNADFIRQMQEYYRNVSNRKFNLRNKKRKVNLDIKKRNDFIYLNKRKSPKDIHDMLLKMGHNVDSSYIRKIIKREEKRRDKKLGKD